MTPGVAIKELPPRGGSRPLNHSLTYFKHVRLPPTALLCGIEKPKDPRSSFFDKINRVAVGTLAIGSFCIPLLQAASYIAARYSLRRTIVDTSGVRKPIMSFQTQKLPILTALAQAFVFDAMHKQAVAWFSNAKLDPRVRHAIATVYKAVVVQASQTANLALGDRCGAQGLFEANQFSVMHSDTRGIAIAEGDLLGISIRLVSELLLGRYSLEPPRNPSSLLARHESGLFSELRAALAAAPGHRSATYDREILPRSLPLVLAIGHRIAYDAAAAAQVDAPLLDLFEVSAVLQDEAWYVEYLSISRSELRRREAHALEAVFPRLEEYLRKMDVAPYIVAPIVSDEKSEQFFGSLPTLSESRRVQGSRVKQIENCIMGREGREWERKMMLSVGALDIERT